MSCFQVMRFTRVRATVRFPAKGSNASPAGLQLWNVFKLEGRTASRMADDARDQANKSSGVSFVLPPAERRALEEWACQHRIGSLGAAVRCMIRFALANGVRPDGEWDGRRKGKDDNRNANE